MWLKYVAVRTTTLCAVVGINIVCTVNVLFTISGNIICLTVLTDVPVRWVRLKRERYVQ